MIDPSIADRLRALPAVDQLAAQLTGSVGHGQITLADATSAARAALDARRDELLAGGDVGEADLIARALLHLRAGPHRVLNGTGVIVHTNLGRAPLSEAAVAAVAAAARGYMDLEFDLTTGRRGARDANVAALLGELTGAEDALVVNNGAAATLLAAAALAGPGRAIVVSRGQLVEIGGGFRVPDVVAQAGAQLVEVGTTNRTRIDDYRAALDDGAEVILRVHQSNFRTVGFVERGRDRCPVRTRRPDDRRSRLRGAAGRPRRTAGRRAAGSDLGRRWRRAGLLQRRQAARRPAGRDPGWHQRGDRGLPAPSACSRAASGSAAAGGAGRDSGALSGPRARGSRDSGAGDARGRSGDARTPCAAAGRRHRW